MIQQTAKIIPFRKPIATCAFCHKPQENIVLSQEYLEMEEDKRPAALHICKGCAAHAKQRMLEES